MEERKTRIIERWSDDPCQGYFRISHGPPGIEYPIGGRDFCDWSEYERYVLNLPWLRSTVRFGDYPGRKVLEIGFGLGIDLVSFARRGAEVYGIELTPQQIDLTRQRFELWRYPCRLIQGDGELLPFAASTFDVVYAFDVLEHVSDSKRIVQETVQVLKPGGIAIIGIIGMNFSVRSWLTRNIPQPIKEKLRLRRLSQWDKRLRLRLRAVNSRTDERGVSVILTFFALFAALTRPFHLLIQLVVRAFTLRLVYRLFSQNSCLQVKNERFRAMIVVKAIKGTRHE